jgi:hypothetical protein
MWTYARKSHGFESEPQTKQKLSDTLVSPKLLAMKPLLTKHIQCEININESKN